MEIYFPFWVISNTPLSPVWPLGTISTGSSVHSIYPRPCDSFCLFVFVVIFFLTVPNFLSGSGLILNVSIPVLESAFFLKSLGSFY